MQEKNITIEQLHKKTEIQYKYLKQYINNNVQKINIYAIIKIADALNVNFKDIIYTKYDLEFLRKSMNYYIDKKGINYYKVLRLSKIIDLIVTKDAEKQIIFQRDQKDLIE